LPLDTVHDVATDARPEDDEPTRAYEFSGQVAAYLQDDERVRSEQSTSPRRLLDALAASPDNDDSDSEPTVIGESRALIAESRKATPKVPSYSTKRTDLEPSSVFVDRDLRDEPSAPDIDTEPTSVTPDRLGEPEPPEQVLEMLATHGVFEPPADRERATDWVKKREAAPPGQRVGRTLAIGWVLAVAVAGGGYYGFTRYVDMRRTDAKASVAKAHAEALEGDHGALRDAERHLIEARELDPKLDSALEGLLFVHAARALEAGGDVGYLRGTIARAERASVYKPMIEAARAVVLACDRDSAGAQREIDTALQKGGDDARVLYLLGRLRQRTGSRDAEPLLARATEQGPDLALAWLARAELMRQAAQPEEARALFVKALGKDGRQLRAELWMILIDAQAGRDPALLAKLDGLAERIKVAAAPDRVLALIARATVLLAATQVDAARAVIREASKLQVEDPELLSLLADRAARVGEHDLAYRAASAAVARAPGNRRYRDALADVLLKRGDGPAVLAALQGIDDGSTWILLTRARAALLSGSRESLEEAKRTLAAHRATERGKQDDDAAALLLRVDLRLGANAESLRSAAKALVARTPDSPLAQLALGENYVLSDRGDSALGPLEKARSLGSDDADLFALLGRAYRQTGQPDKALKAFQHALELAPSHVEAREGLGSFLLDRGDYAQAEGLFATLEKERASLAASLGVIEALLGRGEVAAAKERFTAMPAERRSLPAVIAVGARVAIADKHASDAVKMLEPLVADEESEQRTVENLTLYGDALYAADMVDSAAGAYEAALELDQMYPDALLGRAMAAMRAEKLAQSFELLDRAEAALKKRVRPEMLHALLKLTRAKGFIHKQEFAKAKPLLADAVGAFGAPPEAHFWFAETLAKTKSAGAAEHYAKYVELEPHGEYAARAQRALAPRQ
jgi:tetratricopeptide (TPR) repeat protein